MVTHGSEISHDKVSQGDSYNPDSHSATKKGSGVCSSGRYLQVQCALVANIISLSFGNAVGWSSAVGPDLEQHYSEDEISWIITVGLIGSMIGGLSWSQVTLRIGPQKSSHVVGIPMLIGWCLLLNISNFWCIIIGRLISGFAMGCLLSVVPHYVNEITEDSLRGTLGSIMVLAFNLGTLFVYGLGGFLNGFHLGLVCAALPVVFIILFFSCPESPIFLISKGRRDAGKHNLKRLRYPRDVADEFATINLSSTSADAQKAPWSDVFRTKAARKALGLSMAMLTIQQVSGIIPLLSYVGNIFQKAGGSLDPIAGSCVVAAVQILGAICGIFLIERAGRRYLMIFSSFVMAISHGFLGYALMPGSNSPGWLPVTSLSTFMIAYAVGAGSAPFVIMTELSPPSVRARVSSLVVAYHSIMTFIITKTYSDLLKPMGVNGVFWMYAAGCAAGGVFTVFFLPETAGRSNASIQEELEGKKTSHPAA